MVLRKRRLVQASLSRVDAVGFVISPTDQTASIAEGIDLGEERHGGFVDLSHNDLSGAILWWTDLSEAVLEDADLSGARLWMADLSGADLSEANVTQLSDFTHNLPANGIACEESYYYEVTQYFGREVGGGTE